MRGMGRKGGRMMKNSGYRDDMAETAIRNVEREKRRNSVNHPKHYNIPGRKECLEEMLEKFGKEKVVAFCELNEYKYVYRHEFKGGNEDLKKAAWYRSKLEELQEGRKSRTAHKR